MDDNNLEGELVLVTGANGFLASHIIQQLLEAGYKVRGTVRDLGDESKVSRLRDLHPGSKYPLELVEADLSHKNVWLDVVKDCKYIIMVASPIATFERAHYQQHNDKGHGHSNDKGHGHHHSDKHGAAKEEELIQSCVDGTLNVLRAVIESDLNVERVVLTSSASAVGAHGGNAHPYTENDWPKMDDHLVLPQVKAKVAAERAAWDFVKQLPHGKKFDLTVVNPARMLGPLLVGETCPVAADIIIQLMEKKISAVPAFILPFVDVRDVARAHIHCMTNVDAIGHRHILFSDSMWIKYLAELLDVEFGPQGYHVPTSQALGILTTMSSWFDNNLKEGKMTASQPILFDNTRMRAALGVEPIDLKTTIVDAAYSLIENGFIKKADKYRGPHNIKTSV